MSDKPILFNGPMVRAILDGKKSMTRRVIKPQPVIREDGGPEWGGWTGKHIANGPRYCFGGSKVTLDKLISRYCPYGQPGDTLWVRETCYIWGHWRKNGLTATGRQRWMFVIDTPHTVVFDPNHPQIGCKANNRETRMYWRRPSIHMPRWASRLTLLVTSVRVERLQDISEEDAQAEGINPLDFLHMVTPTEVKTMKRLTCFELAWDSIYGKQYPWESNPWVWVVGFAIEEVTP